MNKKAIEQAQLLPCPFCGSKLIKSDGDGDGRYWNICTECAATGPAISRYDGEEGDPFNDWNTRATAAPDADELQIAINTCKDVTTLGRFSKAVDPVRWVEQLQAHLESIVTTAPDAPAERLEEECPCGAIMDAFGCPNGH